MFTAKSASPLDGIGPYHYPVFDTITERKLSVITAPRGYLLSDSLAGRIMRQARPLVWLRMDQEDRDPATLLLSIISAVRRQQPDFGNETTGLMREKPGPIYGWAPLFAVLGSELRESLDPTTILVFEKLDRLEEGPGAIWLLGSQLIPAIPSTAACILISNQEIPSVALTERAVRWEANDLRLNDQAFLSLVDCIGTPRLAGHINQLEALSEGRPEVLAGICMACNLLGMDYMLKEFERTRSMDDLLENTTRALIGQTDIQSRQALGLLVHLEYNHPKLIENTLKVHLLAEAPWFQPLVEDWERIRGIWRSPLQRNLETTNLQDNEQIKRLGETLVKEGALSQAVRLYGWAGDTDSIAREISGQATSLLDMGQWETLSGWIDQLPSSTLESWPELLHHRGEIAAAGGDFEGSSKIFSRAAALSTTKGDYATACESLLADCVVAARMGLYDRAVVCAMNLVSTATKNGLDDYRGWGLWQIGTIWAILGRLDQAVAYLEQAMQWIEDASLSALLDEVRELAVGQQKALNLLDFHTQALQAAQEKEERNASRLASVLNSPTPSLEMLLKQRGWSGVPAPMSFPNYNPKLPANESEQVSIWTNLLQRYRSLVKINRGENQSRESVRSSPAGRLDNEMAEQLMLMLSGMNDYLIEEAGNIAQRTEANQPQRNALQAVQEIPALSRDIEADTRLEIAPKEGIGRDEGLMLTAYLLGGFRVFVDERPVTAWPSGRGRSLCKYLLVHRERPLPREILMEAFWPSAAFESARNSLNVAVYDMRQAFRELTETPIVEYDEGAYGLNPDLRIWSDVEAFEQYLAASRHHDAQRQPDLAIKALESAASLYQGDFLADDPYEDWTTLTRERLRLAYLEILDRLSKDYFEQSEYSASATLCQLILNRDNCREDAHRRLMRCYSRQGQQNLALRQFYVCSEALRSELEVEPEPATIQIAERIRRHESV